MKTGQQIPNTGFHHIYHIWGKLDHSSVCIRISQYRDDSILEACALTHRISRPCPAQGIHLVPEDIGETWSLSPPSPTISEDDSGNDEDPSSPVEQIQRNTGPDQNLTRQAPIFAKLEFQQKGRELGLSVNTLKDHRKGRGVTKATLASLIHRDICLAYLSKGENPPEGIRDHTAQATASSWAEKTDMPICKAAIWSTPSTTIIDSIYLHLLTWVLVELSLTP
ncbi:unnamed protein product [Ranitomeya imitator]|uniref:Uncharacterized protein n=1 Tax=Ranitomeya imitator TaxID=111125 RepID=A0ABN9L9F4_9NEOB|nr:unnamed protein product [Ranitomeya imitator]